MKVIIIGAGSTAMIVADIISESHNFSLAGFVGTPEEADKLRRSRVYNNVQLLGDHSILPKLKVDGINGFIAAIGDNQIREEVFYEALNAGLHPINAISTKAIIDSSVSIGRGIVISPGVVLSHGVILEDNIIMDPSVILDVDTYVASNCYFYLGCIVCGGSRIEKNVTFGAGSIVEPGIEIGKNNNIVAGTVVRENMERHYRKESNL